MGIIANYQARNSNEYREKTYADRRMQKLTFNTKIGNQMQNLYCRNVRNVKFPKIVAEKFAFYSYISKLKESSPIIILHETER